MRLIVLTGFLGSGKTTAMLALAQELRAGGAKVALLVNEIGEIGIDGAMLRRLGANVWELAGGCICCTLTAELTETLAEVGRSFAPDVVLLEPSGAAQPETIGRALRAGEVAVDAWLALVDPLRLEELVAVLGPLMDAHVRCADAVLIPKADLATASEVDSAVRWVQGLRPELPCVPVNLRDEAGRPRLRELLPCLAVPPRLGERLPCPG